MNPLRHTESRSTHGHGSGTLELRLERDQHSRIASIDIGWQTGADRSWKWHGKTIDVNTVCISYFNSLRRRQYRGRALHECFTHKGWGLWQFVHSHLFYTVRLATEISLRVKDIVESERPDRIIVHPYTGRDEHVWLEVIEEVGRTLSIDIEHVSPPRIDLLEWIRESGPGLPQRFQKTHRLRKAGARVNASGLSRTARKNAILLVSSTGSWVRRSLGDGGPYDQQVGPVADALRLEGHKNIVGIDTPYYTHGWQSIEDLNDKAALDRRMEWVAFDSFETPGILREVRLARRHFRRQWHKLKRDSAFRCLFESHGLQFWPMLYKTLRWVFQRVLPGTVRTIEVASSLLDELEPSAVALTYEQGSFQRALILEASRRGIPTVGLQHGAFVRNCDDTMHDDVAWKPVQNPTGYAIPSLSCVYGRHYVDLLTESGNYPKESVRVTGHWRYDRYVPGSEKVTPEETRLRFDLDPGKPVVVVLTAGLDTSKYLRAALSALERIPDIQIRIKIHPSENRMHILKVSRPFGISDDQYVEGQLQELLSVADLVITEDSSTTALEAVFLGKPVIVGSFDNRIWDCGFADSGTCIKVCSSDEMHRAILNVLHDAETRAAMMEAGPEFLESRIYRADGQAAARVAHSLISLLKSGCRGSGEAEEKSLSLSRSMQ